MMHSSPVSVIMRYQVTVNGVNSNDIRVKRSAIAE